MKDVEINIAEMLQIIQTKKNRALRAIEDPATSDIMRQRVLIPEYQILELAIEGITSLQDKQKKALAQIRQLSFDTPVVPTAVVPTV